MKPAHVLVAVIFGGLLPVGGQSLPPQKAPELLRTSTDTNLLRWHGHQGRSYFLQVSDPSKHLKKWLWMPVIIAGADAEISQEVQTTGNKGFYRICYTDQVPGAGETLETADFDQDGLSNINEIRPPNGLATHPLNPDTDADGLKDGWEVSHAFNPHDSSDAAGDKDSDGLTNLQEYQSGTNPANPDSDGDGALDGDEKDGNTNPKDPESAPQEGWIVLTGDHAKGERKTLKRTVTIPKGQTRLVMVVLHSDEYPEYTESYSEFDDLLEWKITPTGGTEIAGQADVNDKHADWQLAESKGTAIKNFYPTHIEKASSLTAPPEKDLTVTLELAATNISDAEKPSTVMVGLLPVEVRDIKDSTNTGDDVTITPWDTATQTNPTDANIAWIEPHKSATDAAPRMPQLELKITGLPATMTIQAKIEVQYNRGNGARAARNQAEDRVRIPADGSFQTVAGDTWRIWEAYASETFFGGAATLTYKLMTGTTETLAPQTIRFRVGGRNPDAARARTHIESLTDCGPTGSLWFAYAIARSESQDYNGSGSRYNQFLRLPQNPRDNGFPLWGNDGGTRPGGYGMFQVTGNVQDSEVNIPRDQIWNWQSNAAAARVIIVDKRRASTNWMTTQSNATHANGTAVPSHTVGNVTFDGTTYTMLHACTIKAYNGASKPSTDTDNATIAGFVVDPSYPSIGHYGYWHSGQDKWGLCRFNNLGFNYVLRVCGEVQP